MTPDIQLTPAAIDHVRKQLAKKGAGIGIRFSIKKTGCSGFSYQVTLIDQVDEHAIRWQGPEGLLLCVDKEALPYLQGCRVDYVRQGLNESFVFDNPNAKALCGCGESFTV